MRARLAILCPGQGGQHRGMFDLVHGNPLAANVLDAWPEDCMAGHAPDEVLADERLIFSNRVAQPLIVAASLAMWEVLRHRLPVPALVAGYSIGELAAYGVAGALEARRAVRLAAARGRLMSRCANHGDGQAMAAISGLSEDDVPGILRRHEFHPAIQIAADHIIAGGWRRHVDALAGEVTRRGGRLTLLPVEIASHTPLMESAFKPFLFELAAAGIADPAVPVLEGISGKRVVGRKQAVEALSRQLTETIRWNDCMDACAEAGITVALEIGPGTALSRMLRERQPHIACRAVEEFRSIDGIAGWVSRQCED